MECLKFLLMSEKKKFDIFEIKQIYFSFQNFNLHNQFFFLKWGIFFHKISLGSK